MSDPSPTAASRGTRAAFAAALALLAALLVVAARVDVQAPARLGRRVELVELIRAEQARADVLADKAGQLSAQVTAFEQAAAAEAETMGGLEAGLDEAAATAGLSALRGPGVVATLSDSTLQSSPTGNLNDLVIHEQDLQAVINALWAGGAEAMSVNGQRVLATTAIRCVGNTLLLHGRVYSPPYVVHAVGDQPALRDALDRDPVVERFRTAALQYELGFDVTADDELLIPAHAGVPAMQAAQPAQQPVR